MSGSGTVRECKISKYRFWRDYTPSLHGTVKTQSKKFHFSCEAYPVIDIEFHFMKKAAISVPKNAGRRCLYKTALPSCCRFCSARPLFGRAVFSVLTIQFDELPKIADARQIGPDYRMIGFLKMARRLPL
jgi:hypothetical protein